MRSHKPENQANWGQFDGMAFPTAGNHEYLEKNAQGYFDYFKDRMSEISALPSYHGYIDVVGKGYYSVDLNGWHIVSLNTNCAMLGDKSCAKGSAMEKWLSADLAAHPGMPILSLWHAPRYACGGEHGDDSSLQALWADLYAARADFVFTGHNHNYQHWRPLDDANALDEKNGLTEIVVGSGGVDGYPACPDSKETRIAKDIGGDPSMGAFFMVLGSDGSYSFEYQLQSDGSIFDKGQGNSHHAS